MLMHSAGLRELALMPRSGPVRIMCAECGTVNHWSGRMENMRHPTVDLFALYADTHGTSARVRNHLIQLSERVSVDGPLDRIKAKWAEANHALHALEQELDVLSDVG
jgi:hypothetical protein